MTSNVPQISVTRMIKYNILNIYRKTKKLLGFKYFKSIYPFHLSDNKKSYIYLWHYVVNKCFLFNKNF